MVKKYPQTCCTSCGGIKKEGEITFTAELGFGVGVVFVRNVPATVCSLCGADWINDNVAGDLERIVEDARKKHYLVEVTSLNY